MYIYYIIGQDIQSCSLKCNFRNTRRSVKVYEKSLKKVLTFAVGFGIINKHFARGAGKASRAEREKDLEN